jgi:UDP-N-acetyl-2-amino-2-deoxyglucuronate dehydrogenase
MENETGKHIYNILQLRLHPSIIALKKKIDEGPKDKIYNIDLAYITSRGNWYFTSWKGDLDKSGGIATNIGVHFYDMLTWIFGDVKQNIVHVQTHNTAAGFLEFENARVRWFLSVDYNTIPEEFKAKGMRTFRAITIGGEQFEFSEGFTDLHTISYKEVLAGNGFSLEDTRSSIDTVYAIRNGTPIGLKGDFHPALLP